MKISFKWLQSHFANKLTAPKGVANGLIFHSFEVEGVEELPNDQILTVKILPDRAHDCLSHLGVAREVAAIFNLEKPIVPIKELGDSGRKSENFKVTIENSDLCRRYVGRIVRNITVKDSTKDIKEKLENIEQRSINNIVDAANFVMFEMGQPLHAFDLDKIQGNMVVRNARDGERFDTLDDKRIDLRDDTLIIADDVGPLAIAGIKGGKRAAVTNETKNIFLESANFDPINIRRSSAYLNLRTDASKRFENDYSRILAIDGMKFFSGMISEIAGTKDTVFEDMIDIYPNEEGERMIFVTAKQISDMIGISLNDDTIIEILGKLEIDAKLSGEKLEVFPPVWRLDLNIKEDVAEEVGRIYGYDKIKNELPEKIGEIKQNNEYVVANKMKEVLCDLGFSEVYGYSFSEKGDVEIENPLASDKKFLRQNISDGIEHKLELNLKNSIFDQDSVKIFEIGNVFSKEKEEKRLCIGIGYKTKKLNKSKKEVDDAISALSKKLNIPQIAILTNKETETMTIVEIEMAGLVESALSPLFDKEKMINRGVSYKKISLYPRMIRDLALFVPPEIEHKEVEVIIKDNAGELLSEEPILFDIFEKKDENGKPTKISLAFRLIFQSHERTLKEEEINTIISNIISKLEANKDWQVRK